MFKGLVTDVFFDLDHTLWDFERNSELTFRKILSEHRIEVDIGDFLSIYIPTNHAFWKLYREERISKEELRYQRLKSVFDQLGYPVSDKNIGLLAVDYIAHLSTFNHVFPQTVEILNYLKPQYKLHIITNGFQEIQEKKMKNAGIHSFFDHVVNSEMVGVKKPNPLIFQYALARANVLPKNALMIGDNLEADILGAQAVGFHVLHFDPLKAISHEICPMITDLSEIKTYL